MLLLVATCSNLFYLIIHLDIFYNFFSVMYVSSAISNHSVSGELKRMYYRAASSLSPCLLYILNPPNFSLIHAYIYSRFVLNFPNFNGVSGTVGTIRTVTPLLRLDLQLPSSSLERYLSVAVDRGPRKNVEIGLCAL